LFEHKIRRNVHKEPLTSVRLYPQQYSVFRCKFTAAAANGSPATTQFKRAGLKRAEFKKCAYDSMRWPIA